jgi:hypothetical protein
VVQCRLWSKRRFIRHEGDAPLVRIFVASGLHSEHIMDFNYGGCTFELAHEGNTLVRISVASGLHPQPIADFNYSGGTFELAHEGDALIRESQWPLARIPNSSPSRERFAR